MALNSLFSPLFRPLFKPLFSQAYEFSPLDLNPVILLQPTRIPGYDLTQPLSTVRRLTAADEVSIHGYNPDNLMQYQTSYGGAYVTDSNLLYPTENFYTVSQKDQSGNGYNASQPTQASQPLLIWINNKPLSLYDGTDDFLILPNSFFTPLSGTIVFRVAYQWQTGSQNLRLITTNHSAGANYMCRTYRQSADFFAANGLEVMTISARANIDTIDWDILNIVYSWEYIAGTTYLKAYKNGVLQSENTMSGQMIVPNQDVYIGRYATTYSYMRLYSFIYFNRVLSQSELDKLNKYLEAL